jgi:methionyl aminopeptidase
MIDRDALQQIRKAGKIAAQVRREGAQKLSVPGVSHLSVMDFCEERIQKLGGQVAWAQMAVNDTAAHFCPQEDETGQTHEGDVIKIDIGVHKEGWIADNAMTVEVGKSTEYSDLIKASKNALQAAIKLVRPGCQLWELGEAQLSEAEALGFTTIKNLSGHTIERYQVHAGVSIPSFNNKDKTELQEGWQIAIEPFITSGHGLVKEKQPSTIFMQSADKGVRTPHARKILEYVKSLNGLPFTTRWLTREFGLGTAKLGLRELLRSKIVTSYPPLVDVSSKRIAQFEHSMIVGDTTEVYTRHEDDSW